MKLDYTHCPPHVISFDSLYSIPLSPFFAQYTSAGKMYRISYIF